MMILCMGLLKAIPDDLYESLRNGRRRSVQGLRDLTLLIKAANAADDRQLRL